ncbi:hypothetical protein Bca101_082248 [Brassica carinata]
MSEVPVSYVITMLKKKTVTETGMRSKYALLALLSAVILPTEGKKSINTGHIRAIDSACKVNVISITSEGVELLKIDTDVAGPDDDEDVLVDNLVKAAGEGFPFSNSHFKGGATKADVTRMRDEAKKDNPNRKNARANLKEPVVEGVDAEYIANIFSDWEYKPSVASDIILEAMHFANKQSIPPSNDNEENTGDGEAGHNRDEDIFSETFASPEPHCMDTNMDDVLKDVFLLDITLVVHDALLRDQHASYMDTEELHVGGDVRDVEVTEPNCNVDGEETAEQSIFPQSNSKDTSGDDSTNAGTENQETVVTGLSFPNPSFSIGLTQLNKTNDEAGDHVIQPLNEEDSSLEPVVENVAPNINRKSKRAKVVPKNLVGDYQCDKRFLNRAWESYVNAICSTPGIDYSAKFAMLLETLGGSPFSVIDFGGLTFESSELSDIVHRSSHLPAKDIGFTRSPHTVCFLSNPGHMQSKNSVFLNTKFVSLLAKSFTKFTKAAKKENFRFSAAICSLAAADCPIAEVIVMDCNTSLKTDATVATDLRPITQMFPYILRQGGRQLSTKEMKPFTIDRLRTVPQNTNMFESGITSTLLLQAHDVGGVDVCKCITSEVLETEVQRIAVMMYEENIAVL